MLGELYVYDLACPVEARPTVRIEVAPGATEARCPQCGSTFDIYGATHGNPLTGPAADRGYALRRYHVHSGGPTEYRVITPMIYFISKIVIYLYSIIIKIWHDQFKIPLS